MAAVDADSITCSLETVNSSEELERSLILLQIPLHCSSLHGVLSN